ncbi:MAG: hypothetical protein OEV01_13610 [Nitrospira sp.]|nr:hypothetical protein [Nitrospira sp.]
MRCRLFWVVVIGGLLIALMLSPINYAVAKVVALMWIILSIATWMSPMMAHCPSCHKPFYEGWFPVGLTVIKCEHCGVSLAETQVEGQA